VFLCTPECKKRHQRVTSPGAPGRPNESVDERQVVVDTEHRGFRIAEAGDDEAFGQYDIDSLPHVTAREEAVFRKAERDALGGLLAGAIVGPEARAVRRAKRRPARPRDPAFGEQSARMPSPQQVERERAEERKRIEKQLPRNSPRNVTRKRSRRKPARRRPESIRL
jgi:hypothetical protein